MKYLPLIWAGLWRKPLRTTFTILSLVTAFLLFGLLRSTSAGFDQVVQSARMDVMYTGARFFDGALPISYKAQIEQIEGVEIVAHQAFINGYSSEPNRFMFVGAASDNVLDILWPITATAAEREELKNTRDGVIISKALAERLGGAKVGDRVPIHSNAIAKKDGSKDWLFTVVAIADRVDNPGTFVFSFGNYDYLNEERATNKDTVQEFAIRVRDPDRAVQIAAAIDAMFANSGAPTRTQIERLGAESGVAGLGDVKLFVNGIVGVVLFVLLLLVMTIMAQSVRERTPQFGVLKTLGFTDVGVFSLVLAEALLQCLVGAAAGLSLAAVVAPAMQGKIPGPPTFFAMPAWVAVLGLVVSVGVAVLSAWLPALRAARLQIVDALAGR